MKNNVELNERKNMIIGCCERGLKETRSHCVIQLTPKTVLEISSNEGRECGSSTKQTEARLKYDCGHSDWMLGRTPSSTTPRNNSDGFVTLIS